MAARPRRPGAGGAAFLEWGMNQRGAPDRLPRVTSFCVARPR
jgi:hypothetical protein